MRKKMRKTITLTLEVSANACASQEDIDNYLEFEFGWGSVLELDWEKVAIKYDVIDCEIQ